MTGFVGNRLLVGHQSDGLYEKEVSVESVALASGISAEHILDFSLNMNPFGPPSASVRAVADTVASLNSYPPVDLPALRSRLAEHHRVSPDSIYFGCGLDEVIKLLIHAWSNPGDRVLVHVPTFPRYALEARAAGARVVEVRGEDPWTLSPSGIRDRLEASTAELAFLCTPNNPTSVTLADADVEQLVAAFPGTQFVVDEALIRPTLRGLVPLVRRYPNVTVLRTFSKYFGLAGLRVGYAIGHEPRIALAELIRPPFSVSRPAAAAAAAALEDPRFVEDSHARFALEVEHARTTLAELGGCRLHAGDSNMLMIELEDADSAQVTRELANRGLVVIDGRTFRGLEDVDCLRVSLKDRTANARLWEGLREVLACI